MTLQSTLDELPMLAVYEVIDLGIVSSLSKAAKERMLDLISANYPIIQTDPIHDDAVYIYHAFGVHVLNFNPILQNLISALKDDTDEGLKRALQQSGSTSVLAILTTYSVEQGYVTSTVTCPFATTKQVIVGQQVQS